jgi:hypothetical protein
MTDRPTPSQIDDAAILAATETFVNTFVTRHRRERYHLLIHRGDFVDKLHHDLEGNLDARYRVNLTGQASTTEGVLASIRTASSSTDTILVGGPNHFHPGRIMSLEQAIDECLGFMLGAVVLLDGGSIAFFEPEMGDNARCILTQDAKALAKLRGNC